MRDGDDALSGWPALGELQAEVLVQALLGRRDIVLGVEAAVVEDGTGAPLVGLSTDVVARRDGDEDGFLRHGAQGVL